MGGSVPIRALQLQHDITGAVSFKPFMGNRWARDVITAQVFEFMALIHGAADLGMQAKALRVNTTGLSMLGFLGLSCGDGVQRQYFLPRSRAEWDSVGARD